MLNNKGQIILILILIITVALAIGVAIVQKSLVDVSTSSKVEQSSRAFSAAEAGIEQALSEQNITTTHTLPSFTDNSSSVQGIVDTGLIPAVPTKPTAGQANVRQAPLEFPPLAKEDVVQVWLADFSSTTNPPIGFYTQNLLDIYWGDPAVIDDNSKAALELTLVYYDNNTASPSYISKKWYLDPNGTRATSSGFETATCAGYTLVTGRTYKCRRILNFLTDKGINLSATPTPELILIRARLLYTPTSQPLAVQSGVDCTSSDTPTTCTSRSLPPQAREIYSTGTSGETQRRVKVFQQNKVVPPFFDYAIFSAGDISK